MRGSCPDFAPLSSRILHEFQNLLSFFICRGGGGGVWSKHILICLWVEIDETASSCITIYVTQFAKCICHTSGWYLKIHPKCRQNWWTRRWRNLRYSHNKHWWRNEKGRQTEHILICLKVWGRSYEIVHTYLSQQKKAWQPIHIIDRTCSFIHPVNDHTYEEKKKKIQSKCLCRHWLNCVGPEGEESLRYCAGWPV